MLRSWINGARAAAGLVIGRNYVGMAEIAHENGRRKVTHLAETTLPASFFVGVPAPGITDILTSAIKKVAPNLMNRYLPVHVSLSDPAVRTAIFELDELPSARDQQIDLARWRFSREWGAEMPQICACQPLGDESENKLLFALSIDERWQQCISSALAQANVVAWSLSTNSCRQFNRFHDLLVSTGAALVTVSSDAWALWLWDSTGRPRYARSRWRGDNDRDADIAAEIERSILAYVNAAPGRSVTRVYVAVADEDVSLITALNARLSEPCMRLSAAEGLELDAKVNKVKSTAFSSMAAALDS